MKNIRRQRLTELLNGPRFNGDRSKFCATSGLTKGRLSQLLDAEQQFGDVAARNLCDALALPQGWFDAGQDPPPPRQQDDLAGLRSLYEAFPPEMRSIAIQAATQAMINVIPPYTSAERTQPAKPETSSAEPHDLPEAHKKRPTRQTDQA